MENANGENEGYFSPLEDNQSDYDSIADVTDQSDENTNQITDTTSDGNLRRKITDDIDDGNGLPKKQKMESVSDKNNNKNNKNKNGNAKGGLLGDGWKHNKVFKTFILEPENLPNDENPIKLLHIMEIAKLLRSIKINYQELVQAGRNRFKITFANPRHAENLINSKILTNDYKYKISVPTMYKETIGVIRNVPPTISEKDLHANLESERIKITNVERIKKLQKKDLVPTYSIKIYAEGEKLPRDRKSVV